MLLGLGIVVAVILLWKGSDAVVDSSSTLACRFGISELVVGMTIVALGTSAPEVVVSLDAALRGQPTISVGNVVGSNIYNTGLILGLCALLYRVPTSPTTVHRDMPVLLVASGVVFLFLSDALLSRTEGLILIAALAAYTTYVIWADGREDSGCAGDEAPIIEDDGASNLRHGVALALGLGAILAGARLLVGCTSELARSMGFSEWIISLTVVAGGTSLPELATALVAAKREHAGLVIGNLVGSDLFNMLGVLGLASTAVGLDVAPEAQRGLLIMIAFIALLLVFMRSGWRLSRGEGVVLLCLALWRWGRDLAPGSFW